MASLIIAEHDNQTLNAAVASTVAAGQAIGSEVHVLVAGHNCSEVANQAAALDGVSKVLVADDASLEHAVAEDLQNIVVANADSYEHILAAATTFGKNLLPRVAAKLDSQQISEITKVVSDDTFERPIYAGNAIATVQSLDAKKVITVRATAFDAVGQSDAAPVESIAAASSSGLASYVSQELTKSERPELTAAKIVISGGRGMQSGENFQMIENLADKLGAAVGASRAAVDAGYVPNDYQVGQTGKIVAPELYIAVGISGAIQHLAGMKDSKVIVAINKDEDAPIFQVADYGLVADLFTALPELETALDS